MPHVSVKVSPGRSDAAKKALAEEITQAVIRHLGATDDAISVSVQEVTPEDWKVTVYDPEIIGGPGTLFKAPGYSL
ncbi:4-oxalocrotonate tautomerase [Thioclava sp. BHET1]|nr:4-oxalocrotonate tautomerase [Thioclava sp. BHET1]